MVSLEAVKVRKMITEPIISISDYKHHNTAYVQHFMKDTLLGESGWLKQRGLEGRFSEFLFHSDGAASHFKQKATLHYMTELFATVFKARGFKAAWTFGCAGHGKGTWDGLGGTVKNKTNNYLKAYDVHIDNAFQVFEIATELFCSYKAVASFIRKKRLIDKWTIVFVSADTFQGQSAGDEATDAAGAGAGDEDEQASGPDGYGQMKAFHDRGTRGCFYYSVEHAEGFGIRLSACFCPYCMRNYRADGGFGTMPTGCRSKEPYEHIVCTRRHPEWVESTLKPRMEARAEAVFNKIQQGDIVVLSKDSRLHVNNEGKSMQNQSRDPYTYFELALVTSSHGDLFMYSKLTKQKSAVVVPAVVVPAAASGADVVRSAGSTVVQYKREKETTKAGAPVVLSDLSRLRSIVSCQHDWVENNNSIFEIDRSTLLNVLQSCFD
jgi:hypothetical protein